MAATSNFSDKASGLNVMSHLAKRMIGRSAGVHSDVVKGAGLELISILLGIGGPYTLKLLVDGLGSKSPSVLWAGGLVVAFITSWLGGVVLGTWRQVFSQTIVNRLNEEIVDDALKSAMPALAGGREGDSARILGLIERLPYSLQIIVEGLIWQTTPTLLQIAISLVIIAGILKPLYVVILGLTLVGFAFSTWFGAMRQHTVSLDASAAAGHLSETVGDVLRNARRVVLNGALPAEQGLIRERFREKGRAFNRMFSSQVLVALLQYGVAGSGLICLLTLGAHDVVKGRMTIGDFILLQAYAFRLVLPLSGFGFVISQAAIAFINVREVLDLAGGLEEEANELTAPAEAAELVLEDISFSYGMGLSGIHAVSAIIPAGSFTVIVGPNGSGKSTLAQILAGILEPDTGRVLIAGQPLQDVPRGQRFRYLLYVPQTVNLMNRTLLANALYPPTGQSEAELARLLAEWRFYDPAREIDFSARVGEQGERLSGGQVQKLELARIARVKVPAIILDESTSALDPVSEADIIRTLRAGFGAGTTLVLITHRKALAEAADQVLFMKNGTVIRSGTHGALMADSAAYGRLWERDISRETGASES